MSGAGRLLLLKCKSWCKALALTQTFSYKNGFPQILSRARVQPSTACDRAQFRTTIHLQSILLFERIEYVFIMECLRLGYSRAQCTNTMWRISYPCIHKQCLSKISIATDNNEIYLEYRDNLYSCNVLILDGDGMACVLCKRYVHRTPPAKVRHPLPVFD